MRENSNLRPVAPDTLYNLLPFVIRANDPRSAIRAYMEALASEHNFYLAKLGGLPKLQDPTLCASFAPADFGETEADYLRYLELTSLSRPQTTEEQAELVVLAASAPKSIAAGASEKTLLSLLGDAVGADLHGRYDAKTNRELVKTAISRHHIKGTHGSVYVLGRILGFLDLKVRELWSRFSVKDPMFPASVTNAGDFADVPQDYPYWPRNAQGTYDGVTTLLTERTSDPLGVVTLVNESFQQPTASATYTPLVLDDGPEYTVGFGELTSDLLRSTSWVAAVNNRQPFGNFTGAITSRPVLGTYYMAGGTFVSAAQATIPLSGGGTVAFVAPAAGTWANGVELVISTDTPGTQHLQLTGPQSRIKFKSSYFDLSLATDALIFPTLFAPVPVEAYEGVWPVMGGPTGLQVTSEDTDQKVLNFKIYLELIATLRDLFEHIRPITRTVRRESFGLLLRDTVPYAPLRTLGRVVLEAPNNNCYEMAVDANGAVTWVAIDPESPTPVVQFDNLLRQPYGWAIDDDGEFYTDILAVTTAAFETHVVYVRGDFTGFVYLENQILVAAVASPENALSIHGDGTTGETGYLGDDKPLVYEDLSAVADFVSDDAIVEDIPENKPDPTFIFQTAPEDDMAIVRVTAETIRTIWQTNYLESSSATFKDENQAWTYGLDGSFHGKDVRLRATGADPAICEPLPTGDASQAGLYHGYPVRYLDHSGHYVWRDRVTNDLVDSYYTYGNATFDDLDHGGTRVDTSLSGADGQIEGAALLAGLANISSQGFGPTPNDQATWTSDTPLDRQWQPKMTRSIEATGTPVVLVELQVWSGTTITVSAKAGLSTLSTDSATFTVYVDGVEAAEPWVLGGITQGFEDDETVEAEAGQLVTLEISGSGEWEATMECQDKDPLLISGDTITNGYLLMGGGARDSLEITILPDTGLAHFGNYSDDVNNYVTIDGVTTMRGGAWKGVSVYSVAARTGLPGILSKNDGAFPPS